MLALLSQVHLLLDLLVWEIYRVSSLHAAAAICEPAVSRTTRSSLSIEGVVGGIASVALISVTP